jgi:undecaprenyl-diphosphatase
LELLFKAIILGIVEGITEFLPVSSTGHLIITAELINFKGEFEILFQIIIQLGAILAVLFYYRDKILNSFKCLKPKQSGFYLWSKILLAFVPSAVLGYFAKDVIEEKLFSISTVAIALILGAIFMLLVERLRQEPIITGIEELNYKQAFYIGLAQCIALFPGMSRSAATLIGGLLVGLTLTGAAEFSFFLAIPTILAASVLTIFKGFEILTAYNWIVLSTGFIISFLTALFVINKFMAFLTEHSLKPFAYYRLFVGVAIITYLLSIS